MAMTKKEIKIEFLKLVEESRRVTITTHFSPDDDAIASTLAVYAFIKNKFPEKSISIKIMGSSNNRFNIFQNYDKIDFVNELSSELENSKLLIMVDGSQYSRFSRVPANIASHGSKKICFDHHSSPVDKFDLLYLDKNATSASEIIMDILYKDETITPEVAKILLMGIFGDTGTFNYLKPNQLHTFDNVKKLVKISQVEIQDFKASYSKIKKSVFAIVKEYIDNTKFVEVPNKLSYQYSFITEDFLRKNSFSDADTSEAGHIYMADYLRLIENYSWGFIATPKRREISVSLRSLPRSVNVRNIVERLNIGGGHDRAAGGGFKHETWGDELDLPFVIRYLVDWIDTNQLELS
ncbi:MAG: DHH family phosphoesterase [Candidatus Shapirobacteria bacterium]